LAEAGQALTGYIQNRLPEESKGESATQPAHNSEQLKELQQALDKLGEKVNDDTGSEG